MADCCWAKYCRGHTQNLRRAHTGLGVWEAVHANPAANDLRIDLYALSKVVADPSPLGNGIGQSPIRHRDRI